MDTPTTDGFVARFDTDAKFWWDWDRNWLLYGTVYAINTPEPRVVPFETLTIHEGPCTAEARLAVAVGLIEELRTMVREDDDSAPLWDELPVEWAQRVDAFLAPPEEPKP